MGSKTTWDELSVYCMSQCSRINQPLPFVLDTAKQSFVEFLEMLYAAELEHRDSAHCAALQFVSTGEWSEQSEWAAHINYLRMLCAAEFAGQMQAGDHSGFVPDVPGVLSHAVLLSWLCIDHWERCYDVWLKLHAVSLYFSLPLFGVEPATE